MGALLEKTGFVFRQLRRSFTTFPVETLLGVTYFILFLYSRYKEVSDVTFLAFFPLYVLTYSFHQLKWKVPYLLSYFLWIPIMLFCPESEWGIGIAWLLAAILLVAGFRRMEDEAFAGNLLHVVKQMAIAFLLGGVLLLLAEAIVGTIDLLFSKDHLPDIWFMAPAAFVGFVVIPLLCCLLVSEVPDEEEYRLMGILTDKLLTPALLIYTLILYAYAVLILFQWKLPDGGVAYMVTAFIALALLTLLLRTHYGNRPVAWFFDHLTLVAIPPMVLLWIGMVRRISDYGLTTQRVYLLALVLLLTLFLLLLLRRRPWTFQPMALILAVVTLLLTYIPGFSAKDFGIRSQQKRLAKILPSVLVDGRFPDSVDPALEKTWLQIADAWQYLQANMRASEFKEQYAVYGNCPVFENRRENLSEKEPSKEAVRHQLTGAVDLGEYTILVPARHYFCRRDSAAFCFLAEDSADEVLLRCDILNRLNEQVPDEQLLIYENGRYMAVFEMIIDYRGSGRDPVENFMTSGPSLFKKPE